MKGRVAHLLSQRPRWTGSGVALEALVSAAAAAGWEQAVVVGAAADDPQPCVDGLDEARVFPLVFEQESLPFAVPGMSNVMPYQSSRFSQLTGDQLAAYREAWKRHLTSVLARFRPDVIHSHHWWLLSSLVKDVAPRIPVVTHCHGTGLRQRTLCPHLVEEVDTGCRRNDRFVVLHQEHAAALEKEMGAPPARIRAVGSGFRPNIFHHRGRDKSWGLEIAYAGKLSNAKGTPWLLDAVERLSSKRPGLRLHVAGSGTGDEAREIRRRMENMSNAVFHGQLGQQELAELFRRCAVFVLPSFFEGLPLVLVEAAACGCGLVATALPGIVDELGPQLGEVMELAAPPRLEGADRPVLGDLPDFVVRLERAIDAALSKSPPENVGQRVAGMTWDAVFQRVENVWREVVMLPTRR